MLLEKGSDPYLCDNEGVTPWMYALKLNDREILDYFIQFTSENLPDVEKTKFLDEVKGEKSRQVDYQDSEENLSEEIETQDWNSSHFTKNEKTTNEDSDLDKEFYRKLRDDEIDTGFLFTK